MKNYAALKGLGKIYALYDQFFNSLPTACGKGCATCCTANVTMTTLEGLFMLDHWQAAGEASPVEILRKSAQNPGFQPTLTINQLAALCLEDKEIPDESADPGVGPCPLLRNDCCTLYAARPFGCRAMVSSTDCAHSGEADMPDFVLAANNLISQFIEALDQAGRFGNLADILLLLAAPATALPQEHPLLEKMAANRSIPVFMIPPEHRQRMQPLLQALQQILQEAFRETT
jgi:hypothetical protein